VRMMGSDQFQGNVILPNPMRDYDYIAIAQPSPRWFHRRLPGYETTPLRDVPSLAKKLGIRRLLVKDESNRLGLPAFKMLGASWATYRVLSECLGLERHQWRTMDDLREMVRPLGPLTLATATDGNHGRAVARMATLLGLSSRIWVPEGTAKSRIVAIESEGAEVLEVAGGYDVAVSSAAASASAVTLVISDTSWANYEVVPRWVIDGYRTILEELDDQIGASGAESPDAVIVPIGVGAFAAAVGNHFRKSEADRTELIGAEPVDAACMLESVRAGAIRTLPGTQRSIMAGLNCGTPSAVAWPTVSRSFDTFVSVTDEQAVQAMRLLALEGITAGESAAAPLAALLVLKQSEASCAGCGGTVLLFSTEGVTDPDFYARQVTQKLPAVLSG
jgi:diaminopropionate ammonia-lyase